MKAWLIIFTIVLVSGCQSSQLPNSSDIYLPERSTAPLTQAEARYSACNTEDKKHTEGCVCIAEKMFELGQNESFKSYILDEIKCGTSDNARQRAIGFLRSEAVAICNNYIPCSPHGWASSYETCPIYATCPDGTVLNPRNPCEQICSEIPISITE